MNVCFHKKTFKMDVKKKLLVLFIFITLYANSTCFGIGANDSYNSNYNRTTCSGYFNQSKNDTEDSKCHLNIENCLCNDSCIDHGECVRNLKFSYSNDDIYMKRTCLQDWTDKKVEDLCLQALPLSISQVATGDPFLHTPVTSNCTKVTYSNYYCAICNAESPSDIFIWSAKVECSPNNPFNNLHERIHFNLDVNDTQTLDYIKNEKNLLKNLQIVNETWGIYLNISDESSFLSCIVSHVVPYTVQRWENIHYCRDYIAECSFNWNDSHYQEMCYSYTNVACDLNRGIFYRNIHCAICNFENEREFDCERSLYPSYPLGTASFEIDTRTFAISDLFKYYVRNDECPIGSIWDDESQQCHHVLCYKKNSKYKHGSCQNDFNASESGAWNLTCDKKYFVNETEYFFETNETVHINATGKTYKKDEYELYGNGVYICVPSRYSAAMVWISLFGLTLSSICLLIHLLAFAIVPDLRNLSGMNMASLCIALLVASICFIMTAFKRSAITGCFELASLIYYFFFASFMWMNVMAFDIWLTVQKSTKSFKVSSGRQWKKFIFYSLYAWITPGIALAVVLYMDQVKNLPTEYLPQFGETLCWFEQKNAVLVFFAGPLAVVISMNMIFFFMTIRKITVTSNCTTPSSQTNDYRKQLKLCVRLAVVMGLSWISGIVAGSIENQYLDYLFIFLNAFQGLFILIAYTCTSRVRRALKRNVKLNVFKVSLGHLMPVSDTSNMSQVSSVSQDTNSCSNTKITNFEVRVPVAD